MQAIPVLSKFLKSDHIFSAVSATGRHSLALVEKALQPGQDVVELLDDISNTICSVIDPLECLRLTSPDYRLRDAASEAINELNPLMHALNTDAQLYRALTKYMSSSSRQSSPEKEAVGRHMLKDFELYGHGRSDSQEVARLHNVHFKLMDSISETCQSAKQAQTKLFHQLFETRSRLAATLGYDSYTDFACVKKSLKSSNDIHAFLRVKRDELKDEVKYAESCVQCLAGINGVRATSDWGRFPSVLENFISLASQLFRISIKSVRLDKNYFALHVTDKYGKLGTIVLDPFEAEHKCIGPSHFTLLGSKRLSRPEGPVGYSIQHPAVWVSCNLKRAVCLTIPDVMTLLHELGHALQGVFSKTRYQTLSGTRGPPDGAEFLSTFFERIASFPELIMTHFGFPDVFREKILRGRHMHPDNRTEKEGHLLIAYADILLHTRASRFEDALTEACVWYGDVEAASKRYTRLGIDAMCNNEHFSSYGSNYYSYVLGDSLASESLQVLSKNPDFGLLLRKNLLCKGGSVDPLEALASCGVNIKT